MRYKKLSDLIQDIETREGKWKLNDDHTVTFRERGRDKEAVLTASLVAAEPGALVLSSTVKEDETRTVTGILKLEGEWALDAKNRITFTVKHDLGPGTGGKLTFKGAWEVNDNHEIIYTFETRETIEGSGRKRRRTRKIASELVFKGHWDISAKNRLTYLLGAESASSTGGESASAFRFRGTFETTSILAKEGEIRYQLGAEGKTARSARGKLTKTITLFGKWKLSRDLALDFELECADGRKPVITFNAVLAVPEIEGWSGVLPDEISVGLKNRSGEPLGLELVLTKDFFGGDAKTFLRFARTADESAVEAGVKVEW